MEATYEFLDLLGLDEQAQERDIRRAYARRLKQVDQEGDPAGFQRLRDAYETALGWAAWKARQDAEPEAEPAPDNAPAEADPPPAEEPGAELPAAPAAEDPRALAHAVFHRFVANMPALLEQQPRDDGANWAEELRQRLQDDELFNIDARIYFEAYIASILVEGWRPGHESLFVAAQDAFGWAVDPRRLQQFGQTGALLNQALVERDLFSAQPPEDQLAMRRVAKLLRNPAPPTAKAVRADMRHVERMMARFPALMRVIVSLENVEYWRTTYAQHGGKPIGMAPEIADEAPPPPPKRARWPGILLTLALIFVLRALFNEFGGESTYGPGFIPPASRSEGGEGGNWAGQLAPERFPVVSREVVQAHIPPIRFRPSSGARPGKLDTRVRIYLDLEGRVLRTKNVLTSGEPAFDEAVRKALLAAKPFPAGTPASFELGFVGVIVPGAAPADEPEQPPAPAKPLKQLSAPKMVALDDYVPPVQFKPSRFTKLGELKVKANVVLDKQGKVIQVDIVQSSGEPRYDRAVADALRAAKPFPHSMPRQFEVTQSSTVRELPPEPRKTGQDEAPAAAQETEGAAPVEEAG
jgi:protein TonB